jgi:hypothetical protein
MKNLGLFIFVLIGFSISCFSQDNDPFSARMKFEKDTINIGNIKKGAEGNFEFVFTNTGRDGLEIESVTSECACVVTKYPTKTVKKGKQGKIKVSYFTQRVGPINKNITIKSNAAGGIKTITLIGNVEGA